MSKPTKKKENVVDKTIITPISRLVFNIQNLFKKNGNGFEKVLNKPTFLIYLSLALAIVFFLCIDNKVINLVENNAEVISGVPVEVKYNEEAYVVEGVPSTVDITISGRKSDIYLAKQLGEFKVTLDLSDYSANDTSYKVYFTYSKSIANLNYKLDPSYVQVMVKNKVSSVSSVSYELINLDKLDSTKNVKDVKLSKSEVVVKGSESALKKIAWIKALVDLDNPDLTASGTYDVDNVLLVAYDSQGKILNNVEIVPNTLSATLVIDSFSREVGIEVKTTGKLVAGKAIESILINNKSDFKLMVYGSEEDVAKLDSIPVVINIDGLGTTAVKPYTVKLTKPTGVRHISDKTVTLSLTFGEEEQKTVQITKVTPSNLGNGLNANIISDEYIDVICKGVSSVISDIAAENIDAYVDLTGLGVGDHNVEVKVRNSNPLVNYVVSSTIKVRITNA